MGHQVQSRSLQWAIKCNQGLKSRAIRGHQGAIKNNQWQSRAIRGHQRQSRTATHLEREVGRLHLERFGLEEFEQRDLPPRDAIEEHLHAMRGAIREVISGHQGRRRATRLDCYLD